MHTSKKFATQFLLILLCCLSIFVVACSSSATRTVVAAQKAPFDAQVYRYPIITSDISTFDPAQVTDANSITAIDMVFTGLVQMDDHLNVRPQLAASWNTSSDGLTWTFHLRSGLKFSDGTALTSHDVAYSIDRALSKTIANLSGVSLTYLGLIKDADKMVAGDIRTLIGNSLLTPDDNTIIIVLGKATAYFLQALTYPASYVVERKVIDRWGLHWTDHLADNSGQGGDGPFVVKNYDHTKGITLIPNPNFEGSKPLLREVDFLFYRFTKTGYEAYQAGQVDHTLIPSANYASASRLHQQFHKVPQLWISYYGLNYLVKPFDNSKIREAFALAINKDAIVHAIWKDKNVATNHIVPFGMPGYNLNLTGPDGTRNTAGNHALAKQLFQQGLQDEGLTLATFPTIKFTYAIGSQDVANEVITAIGMWQSVLDVTIKPDAVDSTKLYAAVNNNVNSQNLALWRISWIADYPDPQDWLTLQFDKNAPNNATNYGQNTSSSSTQQVAVQQQLEQSDVTTDLTARYQSYNNAEQQLVNDVAWLPIDQVTLTYLLKPYVIGVVDNALNLIPPNDWANIYIAKHS